MGSVYIFGSFALRLNCFCFTVKGTILQKNVYFTTFFGGQLYGPADRHTILNIRETGFTSRVPCLKNSSFSMGDLKILENLILDQN
jgi:hypothetical protein